jgi:hypothetical protein
VENWAGEQDAIMDFTPAQELDLKQRLVFDFGAPEEVAEYSLKKGTLAMSHGIRVRNVQDLPLGATEPEGGWWMEIRATIELEGTPVHVGWERKIRTIGYAI